jgi:hypothetical protein
MDEPPEEAGAGVGWQQLIRRARIVALATGFLAPTKAASVFTMQQVGSNVVVSGNGSPST